MAEKNADRVRKSRNRTGSSATDDVTDDVSKLFFNPYLFATVADLKGAELVPPLGDGLTPSLTVMLANAKFRSFYCKTWHSEYAK